MVPPRRTRRPVDCTRPPPLDRAEAYCVFSGGGQQAAPQPCGGRALLRRTRRVGGTGGSATAVPSTSFASSPWKRMAAATNAVASSPLAICIQGVSLASQFPAIGRRSSRSDGTRTQGQDPSPGVPPSAFLSTCPASSAVFAKVGRTDPEAHRGAVLRGELEREGDWSRGLVVDADPRPLHLVIDGRQPASGPPPRRHACHHVGDQTAWLIISAGKRYPGEMAGSGVIRPASPSSLSPATATQLGNAVCRSVMMARTSCSLSQAEASSASVPAAKAQDVA